jgi:phosphoglycolate phosphatase-like HAD superfamily hydrolase
VLCTQCSQVVKPIVALDIDGTLGDYHEHFERFAVSWLGVEITEEDLYDGTERYGQWFTRAYSVDLETFRAAKLAFRMGGLKRSMPVIQDASLITECLREDGVELWLVTNRPYLKVDSIDPDTRFWLERNRINYDHLLYGPEKWRRLLEQVDQERVVAVVDDDPGQIKDAVDLGLNAIMVRTKYNRGARYINNAQSLYHIRSLVQMDLGRWHHNHVPEITA